MGKTCPMCGKKINRASMHCCSCSGFIQKLGEDGFARLLHLASGEYISYQEQEEIWSLGSYSDVTSVRRALRGAGFNGEFERKNHAFPNFDFVQGYQWRWQVLGNQCVVCGATEDLEVHHIVPINWGGADTINNAELLCHDCHIAEHRRIKQAIQRMHGSTLALRNALLSEHADYIREIIDG